MSIYYYEIQILIVVVLIPVAFIDPQAFFIFLSFQFRTL